MRSVLATLAREQEAYDNAYLDVMDGRDCAF